MRFNQRRVAAAWCDVRNTPGTTSLHVAEPGLAAQTKACPGLPPRQRKLPRVLPSKSLR